MKVLHVTAGESGVFVVLHQAPGQEKRYPVVTSAKKFSAQLGKPAPSAGVTDRLRK